MGKEKKVHEGVYWVTPWEKDLLEAFENEKKFYRLQDSSVLKQMVNKGYFEGLGKNKKERKEQVIELVLDSCRIRAENYDGFDTTK